MNMDDADMNTALMVDGNAVAGQLMDVFGRDMTMAVARCAGCASEAEMGALMAFTRGPGGTAHRDPSTSIPALVFSSRDGEGRGHTPDLDPVNTRLDFRWVGTVDVARRHGEHRDRERHMNGLRLS